MARITVLVQADTAPSLQQQSPPNDAARDVLRTADELGVALKAMHPGVADAELSRYFTVDVPDDSTAQRVIERLNACEAVDAAYMKPPEALP